MADQQTYPPSVLMQGIRLGSSEIEPSRETRILRAALAMSDMMDFSPDGGVLRDHLDDGNRSSDLRHVWAHVLTEHAAGRCGGEEYKRVSACLQSLGALSDIEREAAAWLWMRALRFETWSFDEAPL